MDGLKNTLYCKHCFDEGRIGPESVYRLVTMDGQDYYLLAPKHRSHKNDKRTTVPSWFVHEAVQGVLDKFPETVPQQRPKPEKPSQQELARLIREREMVLDNYDALVGKDALIREELERQSRYINMTERLSHTESLPQIQGFDEMYVAERLEKLMQMHQEYGKAPSEEHRIRHYQKEYDDAKERSMQAKIPLVLVSPDRLYIYTGLGTCEIIDTPLRPARK